MSHSDSHPARKVNFDVSDIDAAIIEEITLRIMRLAHPRVAAHARAFRYHIRDDQIGRVEAGRRTDQGSRAARRRLLKSGGAFSNWSRRPAGKIRELYR